MQSNIHIRKILKLRKQKKSFEENDHQDCSKVNESYCTGGKNLFFITLLGPPADALEIKMIKDILTNKKRVY